jgi:hypothetical protein
MPDTVTVTLRRALLEHREALHLRRMRQSVWLYLSLLAQAEDAGPTIDVDPPALARAMGLPEGTVRSWLGHLRTHRYVDVERHGPLRRVTIRGPAPARVVGETTERPDHLSVETLEQRLGERGNADALDEALANHDETDVVRALDQTLAVPKSRIRRSRTALFLYLLRHTDET